MKNTLVTGVVAVAAVAAFSILSGPLRSQPTPNRPFAVDDASWVPISNRVGIELIEDEQGFRSNFQQSLVQQAHLWVAGTDGAWRRVEFSRSVRALPLDQRR